MKIRIVIIGLLLLGIIWSYRSSSQAPFLFLFITAGIVATISLFKESKRTKVAGNLLGLLGYGYLLFMVRNMFIEPKVLDVILSRAIVIDPGWSSFWGLVFAIIITIFLMFFYGILEGLGSSSVKKLPATLVKKSLRVLVFFDLLMILIGTQLISHLGEIYRSLDNISVWLILFGDIIAYIILPILTIIYLFVKRYV